MFKKVIVIGCPGSGKSTFSRKLKELTNIPLCHLDMLYWNEDRTTVSKEVFLNRLQDVMDTPQWIIDGNYQSSMEMRMKECDTIFFLDYPTELCLEGIASRQGKPRSDMPWTENGQDDEFIDFVNKYNSETRPQVISLLEKYSHKNIIIFHSRDESENFLKELFMLTETNLQKMGFTSEDATSIIKLNTEYSHKIIPIVKAYTDSINVEKPFTPYPDAESGNIATQRADDFIKAIQNALPELDEYASRLIGWINCIPSLYKTYKKFGISEELFFDTVKDFSYKLNECKNLHDKFGLFVDWFFLFFDMKAITLGRLEYEVKPFGRDEYSCGGISIKKGDYVYSCHIPSSGKLTVDMCMDSFQKAYEFFKPQLSGDIIPIVSYTWLLYKPYIEKVFIEGTNLKKFADLFDVIGTFPSENNFKDCWRIFNKSYDGTTENLPADTSLRRSFINYINDGGDFGVGYGILFYNGKTKEIIK